jgi:hypothetical protein
VKILGTSLSLRRGSSLTVALAQLHDSHAPVAHVRLTTASQTKRRTGRPWRATTGGRRASRGVPRAASHAGSAPATRVRATAIGSMSSVWRSDWSSAILPVEFAVAAYRFAHSIIQPELLSVPRPGLETAPPIASTTGQSTFPRPAQICRRRLNRRSRPRREPAVSARRSAPAHPTSIGGL